MMQKMLAALAIAATLPAMAAERLDEHAINRIVDEGLSQSQLALTAAYLTDRIGGRMTNSPQMRAAEKWTQEQFRAWGLKDVRAEGFSFGRGWSIERSSVCMLTPRLLQMRAIPVAWTPATDGAISAPIVVAPLAHERDFAKWRGKLRGKIVLITKPDEGSEPDAVPFQRLSPSQLSDLDIYQQPFASEVEQANQLKRAQFDSKRDTFLAGEGALLWVRKSYRDGALLHGEGYGFQLGQTPKLPGIELAAEDYRKLARLAKAGAAPTLEVLSAVQFHDDDPQAYNILADIPGRDAKAGYVMAGAHLDSWVAADGAQDNGAGSAVVMEAARILAKLGVKPKRTIRFALWSGEEQGLLGSLAYVERYLATRPPVTDPQHVKLNPYSTWGTRWPVTPLPGSSQLAAYFNLDNGSGKVRGIYTEGNVAVVPIFRDWLEPFASMGATTVASAPTYDTDHQFMQSVGIPAFQFIQDPLDYDSRVHHSSVDTFDHLKIADLKQASVILASFLLAAADRDEALPRMPVPRKPQATAPFSYEEADEEAEVTGSE